MLIELVGWLGTLCILGSFYWVSDHPANRTYHIINLVGCSLLLVNVIHHHALPSVAINAVWAVIALRGIWRSRPVKKPLRKLAKWEDVNGVGMVPMACRNCGGVLDGRRHCCAF